jgi:hypothetical protein
MKVKVMERQEAVTVRTSGLREGPGSSDFLINDIVTCRGNYKTGFGFIMDLLHLTHTTRNYRQYSAIADLHTLKFTVAHALGFSSFTSRVQQRIYNSLTVTSNHT